MSLRPQSRRHAATAGILAWRVTIILADNGGALRVIAFDDLVAHLKSSPEPQPLHIITPRHCGTNAITGDASLNPNNGGLLVTCTGQLAGQIVRLYTAKDSLVYGKFVV